MGPLRFVVLFIFCFVGSTSIAAAMADPLLTQSGARMDMYLKQVDVLRRGASEEDRPKYVSVQAIGAAFLDKFTRGLVPQGTFDKEVNKLGVILEDNTISNSEASAWLGEVTPLSQ